MIIKNVSAYPLSATLEKPKIHAFAYTNKRSIVLVKIETDDGYVGYGEAAPFGGSLLATTVVIEEELKPLLIGEDPCLKERLWQKMYKTTYQHGRGGIVIGAISGIDIALWDLLGKYAGMPIYKMVGGYKNKVRAYATSGFYSEGNDLNQLAEEMRELVKRGFKAVKIKVGRTSSIPMSSLSIIPNGDYCNVSIEEDIERVRTARAAIGNEVDLLIDANNGWDTKTAIKVAKALEKYNIYFIEEPVLTEDMDGSARLVAATTIPIAGYETAYTRYEFKQLITKKAVDIVQPDAVWCGGISEALKIAAIANAYHLPVIPHNISSAVSTAANLHVAAIVNGAMIEMYGHGNPFGDELIKNPFQINQDGDLELPDKPGLGIEVDEQMIEKYIIDNRYLS